MEMLGVVAGATASTLLEALRQYKQRQAEAQAARADVAKLADRITATEDLAKAVESGQPPPKSVAVGVTPMHQLRSQLLTAMERERLTTEALVVSMQRLVDEMAAQRKADQASAANAERRARIGTTVGVVGVVLAVASLIVALVAL